MEKRNLGFQLVDFTDDKNCSQYCVNFI